MESPARGRQQLLASLPLTITQTNRGCHWNRSWSQKAERDWKHPVSECCKWPSEISGKCQGVWLHSQARTHSDAFLSHETLFFKYHSCVLRLHRINKICGRQIYLCLQEALNSVWILDHLLWLLLSALLLKDFRAHNKPLVSIFYSSAMTPQTLHIVRHIIA